MTRWLLAALLLTIAAAPVAAQVRDARPDSLRDSLELVHAPPIVVTASRVETPLEEVGAAMTVITREQIERRQYRTVEEALRDVPGLDVVQTGGFGGVTSVFLRGAGPEHAVVLVDGIELNDPSAPAGGYDLAGLLTDGIERIEVLRGPQSTLHGSNAMGGVIHVLTEDGRGPVRASMRIEAGAYATVHGSARAAGSTGTLAWVVQASRRQTDGISAAAGGSERDAGESTGAAVVLAWEPAAAWTIRATLHGRDGQAEIDQGGGAESDDPNFISTAAEVAGQIETRLALAGGRWQQRLGLAVTRHDREAVDETDPARPSTRSRGDFEGRRWKLTWQNDVALGAHRLVAGIDHEMESAASRFVSDGEFGPFASELPESSARTSGVFAEELLAIGPGAHLSLGIRADDHSRFGGVVTYRAAPVVRLGTAARLRGAVGTGFRAPGLAQLLDPLFGNAELEAERSAGYEVGFDASTGGERLRIGATWFATRFEDLIVFDGEALRNVGGAESRGIELTAAARPVAPLTLDVAYTLLDTEEETGSDAGQPLLRRPRHAASLAIGYEYGGGDIGLLVRWVGERDDRDFSSFPAARVELGGYVTMRAAASYRWTERMRFFARVENLTRSRYEEILRFGSAGRALYAGFGASF